MPEDTRPPEALMAIDLEGTSDHLLELIVDNLRQLSRTSHAAFLQRLLRGLTSVDVTEKESIVHWERILARRNELAQKLGRPCSLRTAAVDYFGELQLLRKPILLEYEELEKLRYSAATDPLTGLKNRRMFEEYLSREINRSARYGTSFVLLLLDLRRFKLANDTYGHATGDEILRSVARASVETIRGSDISCRIGGDEFAILLPQSERASAEVLAERIARKFEAYAKSLAPDTPVGIDYGIAIFPEDGEGATELFLSADKNLYESKQRASRRLEPGVSAPTSTPGFEARVREVESATDLEERRRSAGFVPPPHLGLAGEEIQPSEHAPDRRKYERIPVEGARQLGVVRLGDKSRAVKLVNLSFGGVCLLMDGGEVPDIFSARIQVPFLLEAELTLHRVYSHQLPDRKKRVGCSFTPISGPAAA
jgi:diguanylate cyclase (GGDEF)-like protein